ncbi:MAG: ATP-binding protein [Deltaproteobacteria bacterium]|nr:ATP-binding protein [Deltaproteobacteria bacterium]
MKPGFLTEMEQAFSVNQHVILNFNTTDRFCWPEENIHPMYLPYFIAKVFNRQGYKVVQYIPAAGLVELNSEKDSKPKGENRLGLPSQTEPAVVLNRITSLLRDKNDKWLVLIHYGEHLAPQNSIGISAATVPGQIHAVELLHMASFDDGIFAGKSRVAVITYGEMPDLIARSYGYRLVQIDLPDVEERKVFIDFLRNTDTFKPVKSDLRPAELARSTSGMPLVEIEKLFFSAVHNQSALTRHQVKMAKARAIRQLTGDLLEVSEPEETMDHVAGLHHIKSFFQELVPHLREGQKGVPQSILLNGIPGCGKSFIVSALANLLGWVLIQFRNIRGPYVGQSEQQLEHVIRVADQFENSIIFFDEIDQLIGQRSTGASGDSGTSERMLARIFSWIGSMKHRGKTLFIGASNRPDLLDPAMVDRFRVSIPVLHPTKKDISELLTILMNRFDRRFEKDVSIGKVSAVLAPLRLTGRGLQEVLIHAGLRADKANKTLGSLIGMQHLLETSEDYLPSEDPLEMEFIGLTSLSMCSANSFLPWMSMDGLRRGAEIPDELSSDGIVEKKTGRLDKSKLHQKLKELAQVRHYARAIR